MVVVVALFLYTTEDDKKYIRINIGSKTKTIYSVRDCTCDTISRITLVSGCYFQKAYLHLQEEPLSCMQKKQFS